MINVRDISALTEGKKGCYVSVLEEEAYHVQEDYSALVEKVTRLGCQVF